MSYHSTVGGGEPEGAAVQTATEVQHDGVRVLALDLVAAGVPRMAARVFAGILTAEDGKLDAAELGELLQVVKLSPGHVSPAKLTPVDQVFSQ